MKILSCYVENFASYKELEFSFQDKGLALVSGPTGAGKSTLCDIIPWILFGRTAKNGTADEVISWNAEGPTIGTLRLENGYEVTRIRGSGKNDLWYMKEVGSRLRGKDLKDTQKHINTMLGMDIETYLAGAYFHEFSQTAQFFTTTAKVRRTITEQLADLSLAKTLKESTASYGKILTKELEGIKQEILLATNSLEHTHSSFRRACSSSAEWQKSHGNDILDLEDKVLNFETHKEQAIKDLKALRDEWNEDNLVKLSHIEREMNEVQEKIKPDTHYTERLAQVKSKIESLDTSVCSECGATKDNKQLMLLTKEEYKIKTEYSQNDQLCLLLKTHTNLLTRTKATKNPHLAGIEAEKARGNTYKEQLYELKMQANPYTKAATEAATDMAHYTEELRLLEQDLQEHSLELADISSIHDTIALFRSTLISQTVESLETSTNTFLNDYFDAEIRIRLIVASDDELEVDISKDGNQAAYTQLSKGQRQILKLCFGISVMKAISNHKGIDFNCLFFDEALDGMDDNMKDKAFNLLESLEKSYSSIFVVEHSSILKTRFTREYKVELLNGGSEINEEG